MKREKVRCRDCSHWQRIGASPQGICSLMLQGQPVTGELFNCEKAERGKA
jgi:hypothetical protein